MVFAPSDSPSVSPSVSPASSPSPSAVDEAGYSLAREARANRCVPSDVTTWPLSSTKKSLWELKLTTPQKNEIDGNPVFVDVFATVTPLPVMGSVGVYHVYVV